MAETIASRVTSDKSERVDRDRLSSLPTWCSGISDNAGMTGPTSGAPAEPFSAKMIRKALDNHPDATVIVFPREDGQYSGLATDVLGLLEEAGVTADYATDPMATGVHIEKSADVVLPWLLLVAQAIGTAGDLSNTVDGVIATVRWILERRPGTKVQLKMAVTKRPDGGEVRKLELTCGPGRLDEPTERTIRDAIDRMVS